MNNLSLPKEEDKKSDWLGIAASVACLIHCAAGPILLALQPLITGAALYEHEHHHNENSFWHYIFLGLALLAVWLSARRAHTLGIRLGLWASLSLFALGIFLEEAHSLLPTLLLYGGSLGLVMAHVLNLRHSRSCNISH
jgi:hypothetical protein